jgi:cyclase
LEQATTEREQEHARYFIVYYEAIINTLSLLPSRVPNLVYQDVLEFIGSKRRARLIALSGHTASDAILYLPDEQVLFLGDLLFVQAHPYFADGNPEQLRQTFAIIKDLNADVLVPGHGPLGRVADLDAMLEYLNEMQELVCQAIRDCVCCEELTRRPIPAKYLTWIFPNFYAENIEFLNQLCSKT